SGPRCGAGRGRRPVCAAAPAAVRYACSARRRPDTRSDRWAPWLPLGPVAVGFPARRRCRQAGVVVTHALIQSGSCFALLGLVLDEIAVQRELADQRIDVAQASSTLAAPYFLANDSTP